MVLRSQTQQSRDERDSPARRWSGEACAATALPPPPWPIVLCRLQFKLAAAARRPEQERVKSRTYVDQSAGMCVRPRASACVVSLAPDLGVHSVNKHCALRAFAACSAHSSPLYPPNPLYTVRPARVRSRKRRPWRLVMLTFCAIFPPLFLSAPPVSALARCAAPSQPYCTACASVRELPLCPPPSHPLVPAPSCALGNRGPISSSDPAALIDVLTKRRVHRPSLPDSGSTRP